MRYKYNDTVYCSQCKKPRYMGYTDLPDSKLCTCKNQDKILTYEITKQQMNKIELIKQAIADADIFKSGLNDDVRAVPFLGSLKNRALMNNLGKLGTRYLEVGSHKGGSFCSAIFGNDNLLSATSIDSFESDHMSGDEAKPQFLQAVRQFKPSMTNFNLIQSDCFKIDFSQIPQPIDFYLFDGPHGEDDQARALTYYLPVLADEFIFCCDDYSWLDVRTGTQRGIKEAGLEVLFEQELVTDKEYNNESWWTGFYCALLKKK